MIIVDKALRKREENDNPIRVGMVGAGFMGRGVARQIVRQVPGMQLSVISNRHLEGAHQAFAEAGVEDRHEVNAQGELEDAITADRYAVTEDEMLLCHAEGLDVILEVTGDVEFGAGVALEALRHDNHIVAMNAELDGTVGPLLKAYADKEGLVFTNVDGDQPGVILNLYRFVQGIGVKPVLCGNIKGLQDPYRNPTTQKGFAEKWGQKPHMVTSFADGTKISFEQTIVANATGMNVAKRGMLGPEVEKGTPVEQAAQWYPTDYLMNGPGIVDYVVGADPAPGVFVIGRHDDPVQQHYLRLYKLGEGPLYVFYRPYHLCHFEVHNAIARAVDFNDATIAPRGAPMVDVVATAKRDLKEGEVLDGIGFYMTYGQCENSDVTRRESLLPMGLAEGCRLKQDISKDQVLSFHDVELPDGRLSDQLWTEQNRFFNLGQKERAGQV